MQYNGVLRVYQGEVDNNEVVMEIGFTIPSKRLPTLQRIFKEILREAEDFVEKTLDK